MTPIQIMHALGSDNRLRRSAMVAARHKRDIMVPVFIDLILRLTKLDIRGMRPEDTTALIPVIYLLGEFREPRAYRPLLDLLRRDEQTLAFLLGDILTETLFLIVAGIFDGDLRPLFDVIEDREADEFVRWTLLNALVKIATIQPDQRTTIEDYFRNFPASLDGEVQLGWIDGIANLGLADMTEEVRSVFDMGLISPDYCVFSDFLEDMQAALDEASGPATSRYKRPLIDDAIGELSTWYRFSEELFAKLSQYKKRIIVLSSPSTEQFVPGPHWTDREDPCPCGSGNKFRSCCLH